MDFPGQNLAHFFRTDQHLQQFVLTGVTPTGRTLGTGSYGTVQEVTYRHIVCAGKKMHEALLRIENDGVEELVDKYQRECQLMASLRHPNIIQFLGLCFLPDTQLPLLVMERMEMSLDDLLDIPHLPLSLKCSILVDVAGGLVYLHTGQPPIIHRDLTARNVLLTSSLSAKITDMGNSRITDMRPGQLARTLTRYPGTLVYMPPEATDDIHHYGTSLDIFSLGHLALYTLIQTFPSNLRPSTYPDLDNPGEVHGRTELERREVYIVQLETQIGGINCQVVQLVKQCLHNTPAERPDTEDCLAQLQRIKEDVEGDYGASLGELDIARVRLAKELKQRDRHIETLTQRVVRGQTELDERNRRLENLTQQMEIIQGELNETTILMRESARQQEEASRELEEMTAELAVSKARHEEAVQELDEMARQQDEHSKLFQDTLTQLDLVTEQKEELAGELEQRTRIGEEALSQLDEKRKQVDECISLQQATTRELGEVSRQLEEKKQQYEDSTSLLQVRSRKLSDTILLQDTMSRELEEKSRMVDELTRDLQEARRNLEAEESNGQELRSRITAQGKVIVSQQDALRIKSSEIDELHRESQEKDNELRLLREDLDAKEREVHSSMGQVEDLRAEMIEKNESSQALQRTYYDLCQPQEGMRKLGEECTEEIKRQPQETSATEPLNLKWRKGPEMPFEKGDYLQSAVVQGTLYVGGGSDSDCFSEKNNVVMEYRPNTNQWNVLPRCKTQQFAMTVIHNQLVLVGGKDCNKKTRKILGVWKGEQWIHNLYLDMPIGRSHCSAMVYQNWLAVTGGWSEEKRLLDSVVLLDTVNNSQWYNLSHPMPVGSHSMKSALVGHSWYLMGGWTKETDTADCCATDKVYSVSFHALLLDSLLVPGGCIPTTWKEIDGLNCIYSTPLSFGGSLLAIGGSKDDVATASVQALSGRKVRDSLGSSRVLRLLTGHWEEVGVLPDALYNSTSAVLEGDGHRELLVAGGDDGEEFTNKCVIAAL